MRACIGQSMRDGTPDAAGPAGDDCGAAIQSETRQINGHERLLKQVQQPVLT
jgi:hypothetical protein